MLNKSIALALAMGNLMGIGGGVVPPASTQAAPTMEYNNRGRGKGKGRHSSRPSGAAAIKRASRKAHNIAKYARGSR